MTSPCYASSMSPVGINIPRADGPAKVRGDAQYVDDIRPTDCLYGATVRSPIAHGKLLGIRCDPDFDWSEITVVTAADIPAQRDPRRRSMMPLPV